jgi:hypothetical protein
VQHGSNQPLRVSYGVSLDCSNNCL